MSRRRDLDDHGRGRRERAPKTKAHKKTQRREQGPCPVRNDRNRCGAECADKGAADDQRLAAPQIGQRAATQSANDGADAATQQDDRRLAIGEVPSRSEHRDEKADAEKIKEISDPD
jgi:hypothetical protein